MAEQPAGPPEYADWIGRTETSADLVTAVPAAALAATLDREDPFPQTGDPLPPLWHWLYFHSLIRQSELGPDGHARGGGFLPPFPLPKRMWAGSRLEFRAPLRVGDSATRSSRILKVQFKKGRTGPLYFVTVSHTIGGGAGISIVEESDIVYRDYPKAGQPTAEPPAAPAERSWERTVRPDEVLLFRYSALTFNSHRIHYDWRYCAAVESYPGLVVHGPLMATLLADLVRRNLPQSRVTGLSFRAVSPLFVNAPFRVCGQPGKDGKSAHLWAQNDAGQLAMDATATLF
ncbi:MAG TPA: MaoC family dehydratase N-terminal domain-containing protein [Candidatus Dormibacteraeota bacterium]|nr:MaoC family dehydratase N-terminal domain-containing protein [Candidatus Dormibacteraeota bacterium]